MRFESLAIANLRCLERVDYCPSATVNLICGANGSGKTSVLEAFALASWGKSFLSNRVNDIVRSGAQGLSIRAQLTDPSGLSRQIYVRKRGGETAISLDGQAVAAASVLAQTIPLLVINSKAADVLTESPSNRRALIDRTMFHVEPSYVTAWKNYRQALRQRNQLLRRQAPQGESTYWDNELVKQAQHIDSCRIRVVELVNQRLATNSLSERLGALKLDYSPGWKRSGELSQQLEQAWSRDLQVGHTTIGIHRADLALRANGKAIARKLSRGQGKYLVVTVFMALADFIRQTINFAPVVLVDDLAAELDDKMAASLVDIIDRSSGQRIYTAIRPTDLPTVAEQAQTLFHVEQAVAPPAS